MKNEFILDKVIIDNNRIDYKYHVNGNWQEAFEDKNVFFAEYDCDITNVPESIAVIPLLCNILPIAWLFDAEINVKTCDEDFFKSIEEFKKGYINMYPDLEFKGKIIVQKLQKNVTEKSNGSICFFSGGVDAFNTLLNHLDENVTLLTLCGADIKLEDVVGWHNVLNHIKFMSESFGIDFVTIKSNLKNFYNEKVLNDKIQVIKKEWYHDFQHGIGIISFASLISYITKKTTVYFASSFTAKDIGSYTCASDPTIDNFVRFCGAKVIHDGYEFSRQDKVHNIVKYCLKNNKRLELRVCWQSTGGKNCCQCEKCYRTMLAIFAEGEDPRNYGFNYTKKQLRQIKYCNDDRFNYNKYSEIQRRMREKCSIDELPKELRWFYKMDIRKLGNNLYKVIGKFKGKIKNKIKRFLKL